ncbi:MAG: MobA/MobL family protein, partial [Pacificimonas sp.]
MGETQEEVETCWRALEAVELADRANAKVQFRIVLALPHELKATERETLVRDFCEDAFGRADLPYV